MYCYYSYKTCYYALMAAISRTYYSLTFYKSYNYLFYKSNDYILAIVFY